MNRRLRTPVDLRIAVALLLAGLSTAASWAAPRALAIRDLGAFDGMDSVGFSLNDRGQIVGVALVGPEEVRSFLWNAGTMIDLGPGNLVAFDINDRGQILLQQFHGRIDEPTSCFLRDGETMINLWTLGGTQCFASDLNNRGQVVGVIEESDARISRTSAFLWESGAMTDLGSLGGGYAIATALNDRGQVVGGSTAPSGEEHAFLWEAGKMADLGAPGASWSVAYAINNRGQVVVQSGSHVYLWEAGSMTDLGTLGGSGAYPDIIYPLDINERGQILLAVYDAHAEVFRYGIWEGGTMIWLPTLGGGLPTAFRLNDRGQVVGADRANAAGVSHVVLWTPSASPGRGDQ